VEALGQHVQEKAPDELVRVEPHRLPAVWTVDPIIFPAERDAGVVGGDEAAVRLPRLLAARVASLGAAGGKVWPGNWFSQRPRTIL
jgi:hypothetical protein